jgi:hypothetical protein
MKRTPEATDMSDEILAKAMKERDYLRERLEKVEAFIELHREFAGQSESPPRPQKNAGKRQQGSQPKQIADWAERLIRKAGRPLTRGQLAEAMAAEGVEIRSSDVPRYIGTVLWRLPERFENVEDGYWLVGVPRPFV